MRDVGRFYLGDAALFTKCLNLMITNADLLWKDVDATADEHQVFSFDHHLMDFNME